VIARTLADDLRRSARAQPQKEALVAGERRVTYAELDELADRIAGGLMAAGVRRGDRVGVFLPNGVEACAAIYGTLRAGAAFSPLNPTTKADKLGAVLHDAGAAALICDAGLASVAREAATHAPSLLGVLDAAALCAADLPARLPPVLSVDLAAVIYTSGSTGVPKGVTLTHQNMTFAAGSISEYLELSADDRILVVSPLSFDYGLYQLLMAVLEGATLIVERGFAFPGRVVELLERESVSVLPGVPTVFGVLLGLRGLAERELPHLRALTNTGAALSAATIEGLRQTFPKARIYSMYGLTECKRVSYLPPDQVDVRPTSVGVPIPGTEVWIEDDEHNELGPGEIGELMVRGAHVMQGYWNDPETTAQRLRPGRYPWERVLATGDLFRRDEDGFLYFVGRRDDIIKSRGEKVAPREVEEVLHAHPGVRDAAVLGVADELLGQAVHAYVTPAPGVELDERELRRHCAAHLEDYMVPQRVFVRDDLPKSAAGKIDRRALQSSR
jgi:long-chain acyl-CoA synthetase